MATLTELLSRTRASLDAGNDEAALTSLLAAWKEVRHPRLADAVDRISERVSAKRPPITGKTVKDRTALVIELAKKKNPADLGVLLATPWPGTWQPAVPVMEALRAFEDPRVAMAFCKLVDATPYDTYTSHRFYGPLLAHVAKVRDARCIPLLKADQQRVKSTYWRQGTRVSIEQTLNALKKHPPPPFTPAEEAALVAVEAVFAAKLSAAKSEQKTEAQYLAEIYAAPDDEGARAVYADWLTEKGDPRGEFISLQLASARGAASEAALKRERALRNKHEKQWLGERARVLEKEGREWKRGFLSRGVIEVEYGTREPGDELLDPAWNTLDTLSLSWRASNSIGERLLRAPWFSWVRRVRGFSEALVHVLARQPPNARLVELDFQLDATLTHAARADVFSGKAFPAVRHLALEGNLDLATSFLSSPLAKQLTRATWVDSQFALGEWLAAIEKAGLKWMQEVGAVTAYRQRRGNHWKLTLRRDGEGRFSKLHGEADLDARLLPPPDGLVQALDSLPADSLTEVVVSGALPCEYGQSELAMVTKALKRFPSAKMDVPWQQLAAVSTPTDAVPARVTFHGEATKAGANVAAHVDAATRLGLSFDGYEVDGGKLLALETSIPEVVASVFAKKRTREVTFLRKGQTWTGLKFDRGYVELAWPLVPGATDVLAWAAETVDRTKGESAGAVFRTRTDDGWTARYDLGALQPLHATTQWLLALPESLDARVPFDALIERVGQAPLEWIRARRLKNGALLLQLGPTPAEPPSRPQVEALKTVIHELVWHQWKKDLGFSPLDWLRDVAKAIEARGFTQLEASPAEQRRGELNFIARPETGARLVLARLDDVLEPTLALALFGMHAPGRVDLDLKNPPPDAMPTLRRVWARVDTGLAKRDRALAALEHQLDTVVMPFFDPPEPPRKRGRK